MFSPVCYDAGMKCSFPGCANTTRQYHKLCSAHEWQRRMGKSLTVLRPYRVHPAGTPHKIYSREHRKRNLANVRTYSREWAHAHPEFARKSAAEQRKNNPERVLARNAVYRAVRSGRLVRPDRCSKCGTKCKPNAHHHKGYQDRLNVIWLCVSCHFEEHPKV